MKNRRIIKFLIIFEVLSFLILLYFFITDRSIVEDTVAFCINKFNLSNFEVDYEFINVWSILISWIVFIAFNIIRIFLSNRKKLKWFIFGMLSLFIYCLFYFSSKFLFLMLFGIIFLLFGIVSIIYSHYVSELPTHH